MTIRSPVRSRTISPVWVWRISSCFPRLRSSSANSGWVTARKAPSAAEGTPGLVGVEAAVLGERREDLLHQGREVQGAALRRLAPAGDQEADHGDGLHQVGAQGVVRRGARLDLRLLDVAAQHRGSAVSPGAAQALAQAGDGGRRTDLRDALDGADVDPQLQGGGADGGGRPRAVFDRGLGVFPQLAGEAAVVRPELGRDAQRVALPAQQVGVELHVAPPVGEDQMMAAAQPFEEMPADIDRIAGDEVLQRHGLAGLLQIRRLPLGQLGRPGAVAADLHLELLAAALGGDALDGRRPPPGRRNSQARPRSPRVADSAMRGTRRRIASSTRCSSDWSCAPRSVPMKACSSSITT